MRKMADGESITLSTAISAVGDDGAPKGRIGIPHFTFHIANLPRSLPLISPFGLPAVGFPAGSPPARV